MLAEGKDTSQRGTCLPERFLTVPKNSSDESPDSDGPVMVESHVDWNSLDAVHILGVCLTSEPPK